MAGGRPTLVLVDDADTRADLGELIAALTVTPMSAPVRVMIIAREFGDWWTALVSRADPAGTAAVRFGRTVIGTTGVRPPGASALALRDINAGPVTPQSRAIATLTSADPVSAAVLLRLAALVVALPTRVGQVGPAELRSALRDLFDDEEGYWQRVGGEVSPPGEPQPALRAALACAAVIGADGISDAATVLRRVPALAAGAADRLARLAVWWRGLFVFGAGDSEAVPRLPSWLIDRLPDGVDSTGVSWTVAALNAERRSTATLARLARDAHRDVWPGQNPTRRDDEREQTQDSLYRAVRAAGPVDEAIAWLIHELELEVDDLEALGEAITYPAQSLGRTAVVLAERLLENAVNQEQRASLTVALGARLSELGRWSQAREVTEQAVTAFRLLTAEDRDRYLPELATAVANLGSCLANLGDHEEALNATYEAVGLYRELVEVDRDEYLPSLGRGLTNLSACLSKLGRRPAALGAAGQAVAIYRELTDLQPYAYRRELAAADHNWRVCRDMIGTPVAGRKPAPLA